MKVRVFVSLKNGVLDPQGRAIHHAIEGLGIHGVQDVRAGKMIELDVDANARGGPCISAAGSAVSAWVVPTNEELMIARHTQRLLGAA